MILRAQHLTLPSGTCTCQQYPQLIKSTCFPPQPARPSWWRWACNKSPLFQFYPRILDYRPAASPGAVRSLGPQNSFPTSPSFQTRRRRELQRDLRPKFGDGDEIKIRFCFVRSIPSLIPSDPTSISSIFDSDSGRNIRFPRGMSTGDLLKIQPTELKFPFELKRQSSCCMQLTNKTDQYVAFKVKTTNPKKYCVRPNTGVVQPGSTCDVQVTMQAQKEAPPDMQCKDKFLLQSVVANDGATTKDITPELFNKEAGKIVEEFKLRVVYIPANPPSPVPEESEEGSSPRSAMLEDGTQSSSMFDSVSRSFEEASKEKSSEASSMISKLTEEKNSAVQQNQKLRQELDLLRKEISNQRGGFSVMFVFVVALLGIFIGYILKKT